MKFSIQHNFEIWFWHLYLKFTIWNLIWTFGSSNDHIWETKKKLQLAQKFWSCWWFPSTKSNLAAFFHFSGIFAKETILSGCPGYHGEGLFRKWSEYAQGPFYASLSIGTFELSHVLKLILFTKLVNCNFLRPSLAVVLYFSRRRRGTQNLYTNTCWGKCHLAICLETLMLL